MVMVVVIIIVIIMVVMINNKNQQYLHPSRSTCCVRMLLLESVQNVLKEHEPAKLNNSILGIMQEESKKILVGPVED